MFVEEFCRVRGIDPSVTGSLRAVERSRNPVGFMTEIDPTSVAESLRGDCHVYDGDRMALVGPEEQKCGMLLFFDEASFKLSAIEGYVYGETWSKVEEPAYWSEATA